MKYNPMFILIIMLMVFCQIADADPGPMVLFYNSAAAYTSNATSNAALPIGNGKLAAMVYGGMSEEIIQFNEDTVWAGQPHDYSHPGAVNYLQQIQDEVWAGDSDGAWAVADDTFMSVGGGGVSASNNRRLCPYEPTAELRLTFGHSGSNYRRQLDLTNATASVTYTTGGVTYQRDCFASYPDHVIVVRLTASQSDSISFTCSLTTPHTVLSNSASGTDVVLHGAVDHEGRNGVDSDIEFESRVRVLCEGGSVSPSGSSLVVSNADAVTLVLGAASNFVSYDDISADESSICLQTVADAAAKSYAVLRQAHLDDYQPLFNRVVLDLGTSSKVNNPTDQRIDDIEAGVNNVNSHGGDWSYFNADDLQLVALNFQMGRYLLIAGSRPGSQPLNLQGKWNNELEPSWEGKMTLNINEEMNYWGAEVTNLGECQEPLIDMTKDLSESGATVASVHYGADGWVVHHNTDLWRGAAPINGADGLWTTGGAWLCMHLWWHYEYSQDTDYLTEIYPLMKGAAEFFVDFLVEDPDSTLGYAGYLLTNPSYSPEHDNPSLGANVAGAMMDNQLVRCLFTYVIEASEILGIDATFRQQLETMRAQLPPNKIGQYGQLQEWIQDVDQVNDTHRHMSHLVDLMPAGNITPIHTPALAAAAEVVLDWKGDATNNTSWSQAMKMCCRTRLLQGDHAYEILNLLFGKSHTYNMTFSRKGGTASGTSENQIDGNLGVLMGTAEMFLQSDQGEVYLLPALPSKMETGNVTGLRARGGFEVDIVWDNNELQTAQIHSLAGKTCRVRSAWPITVTDGVQSVAVQTPGTDLYEFDTEAGHTYTLTAGVFEDLTPPTPDPMTWSVEPYPVNTNSISMTATTATDVSGVEYYFANLTDPAHDSDWQTSTTYVDTSLEPGTTYSYQVQARDMSANQNTTGLSDEAAATTDPWICAEPIDEDLSGDCQVNLFDFAMLAIKWLDSTSVVEELVVNGDFSTDLSGWTTTPNAPMTITWGSSGAALLARNGATSSTNNNYLYQNIAVESGKQYEVNAQWKGDLYNGTEGRNWAEVFVGFGSSPTAFNGSIQYKKAVDGILNYWEPWDWESVLLSPNTGPVGPADGVFTATNSYMTIGFNLGGHADGGGGYYYVDNVSVVEAGGTPCPEIDLTGDCLLNIDDLEAFADVWLTCNRVPASECWQ